MYQETAKCEVQTPKLQSSVQRINQMKGNALCFNHKFRLIPVFKGEPEIIK